MSMIRLYQVYDREAQAGLGIIMSDRRDAPVIRTFNAVLANKETLPGQYPDHFELRLLGTQDEQTSIIEGLNPPQIIATGAAWAAAQNQDLKLVQEA